MKKLNSILILSIFICLNTNIYSQTDTTKSQNSTTVVYGKKHVFTIDTPQAWVNDKDLASNFGLFCFFYPESDSVDQLQTYIYALGIDKLTADEDLDDFLSKDLEKFILKYPNANYKSIPVKNKGDILNSAHYSYSNLDDRFKEEVLYCEVDSAYIILTFSAFDSIDYAEHLPTFDNFVNSFEYKGSNPKLFLDYEKNKQAE